MEDSRDTPIHTKYGILTFSNYEYHEEQIAVLDIVRNACGNMIEEYHQTSQGLDSGEDAEAYQSLLDGFEREYTLFLERSDLFDYPNDEVRDITNAF